MKVIKTVFVIASFLLILTIVGCSSGGSGDTSSREMLTEYTAKDTDTAIKYNDTIEEEIIEFGNEAPLENRKIIKNKFLIIETLEFDKTSKDIEELVYKYNGYIENSVVEGVSINNKSKYRTRSARFVLRIPADSFNNYIEEVKKIGHVLQEEISKEDVTMQYLDMEARIRSLEVQEERLLELLETGSNLEEILALEKQLSEVRYEIESYTSSLNNLKNKVNYGTVTIDLREVIEITEVEEAPKTFGEKISQGFKGSLNNIKEGFINFIIWLISAIPYIIILSVFTFIIVIIIKKIKKSILNRIKGKTNNLNYNIDKVKDEVKK